jgi:hypothetical protein
VSRHASSGSAGQRSGVWASSCAADSGGIR